MILDEKNCQLFLNEPEDSMGVKSIPIRQDLFDTTVGGIGTKTKDSEETVRGSSKMITKTKSIWKKWGGQRNRFGKIFWKFKAQKEYKFTLHWVRLRLHLLNITYFLQKCSLPLHGRSWIQAHSQMVSFRQNPEFQKKVFNRRPLLRPF